MTINQNTSFNSGVQANIGMDFQKNCTIYILLSRYSEFEASQYFILLEHLEDIVFAFVNERNELVKIETCQAKKSTTKWTIGKLYEILQKITEANEYIVKDPFPKASTFYQENFFATNNTIELKATVSKNKFSQIINETNEKVEYKNLDQEIKDKILKGNKHVSFSPTNTSHIDSLIFKYIDMGRTPKSQLEQLNGMFVSVFGELIEDHKAALYSLYYALEEIERKFNQGNIAKLSDDKKKINSSEILDIFSFLTKKKLAFDFWREKGEEICESLDVSIFDVPYFKLHYQNSVDKFKDITESEHAKILKFVFENKVIFKSYTKDKDCIVAFVSQFNKLKSTTFMELQLKAVIAAAYIEVKHQL